MQTQPKPTSLPPADVTVFRQSALARLPLVFFTLFGLGFWAFLTFEMKDGPIFARILIGFAAVMNSLFFLLCLNVLIQMLGPDNWVLRISDEGLEAKLPLAAKTEEERRKRPYEILTIRADEIRSVRRVSEKRKGISTRGTETVHELCEFLEFEVDAGGGEPVCHYLQNVDQAAASVMIAGENKLRVAWRTSTSWLTPGIDKALALLPQEVRGD